MATSSYSYLLLASALDTEYSVQHAPIVSFQVTKDWARLLLTGDLYTEADTLPLDRTNLLGGLVTKYSRPCGIASVLPYEIDHM